MLYNSIFQYITAIACGVNLIGNSHKDILFYMLCNKISIICIILFVTTTSQNVIITFSICLGQSDVCVLPMLCQLSYVVRSIRICDILKMSLVLSISM